MVVTVGPLCYSMHSKRNYGNGASDTYSRELLLWPRQSIVPIVADG